MKAVILCGGLGTRLRPLTNTIPKVMVDIGGKPLLWYHLQLLKFHKIDDVWINLHWLPEKITSYFGDGSKFGLKINYSLEKELIGSSGALKNPDSKIAESLASGTFLVTYGDNFTNFDYSKLIKFHNEKNSFMTFGLYHSPVPWQKGVIETDSNGKIVSMREKPPKEEITTDQVNGGIYVCNPSVLDYIPSGFSDFGFDIIPKILADNKDLYGLATGDTVEDIGYLEKLEQARVDFAQKKIIFPF